MDIEKTVAEKLLQINAIKLSPHKPFIWASGIRSPIYCDNRLVLSHIEVRDYIKSCFIKTSSQFNSFDTVAGVATAGIPHGVLLADAIKKPFIYVRSKPKSHGRGNQIEGDYVKGSKVLLVEDLISTGGSSLEAVKALKEAGLHVVGVIAIFTYELEKAKIAFMKENCKLVTLSNYNTLIKQAHQKGHITEEQLNSLANWRKNPETWSP